MQASIQPFLFFWHSETEGIIRFTQRKCYPMKFDLLTDNKPLAVGLAIFSILPLVFSSLTGSWLLLNPENAEEFIARWEYWLLAATGLTMAFGLTPTTFVALVSGYFLGLSALLPIVVSYTLASGMGFGLGRYLDGGRFQQSLMKHPQAIRVAENIQRSPWQIVILSRLSPALPFCLMNLLMAALKVRLSVFLLAGAAGMLPRTVLSLWFGSQSRSLIDAVNDGGGTTGATIALVLSLVTILLLTRLIAIKYRQAID